jgi:hypothetical protein
MITERDTEILRAAADYYVLSRAHIGRLRFPDDNTGRATRRRLQVLVSAGLLNRTRTPVFNPNGGSPWPAYYPSRAGLEFLAEHFEDERFLAVSCRAPEPYHLHHFLAITETHITLDQAIAAQSNVRVDGWLNEFDVVSQQESAPERRYRLYTLLKESPRLICAPDAAFMLGLGDFRKVFYLEQDRATTGIRQVAARKIPGYAELACRGWHVRHFPQTTLNSFTVLLITPTPRRRDGLRKAIREKGGANLWKFASQTDITPDTFLFDPIFYPCEGDPVPLVKASSPPASEHKQPTHLHKHEQPTK